MHSEPVRIISFGIIADKLQARELALQNIPDTDSLMKYLSEKYPDLSEVKINIAVNKNIITQNTVIIPGSEVALLPPFSGG